MSSRTNLPALGALLLMNGVESINQTNIASLNLPISVTFHQTVYGLGILSSSFFIAYAFFELPGGIVAARIGARKLLILGGLIIAISVMASAASPNFTSLIILRFFTGIGLGFSFPPILVLIIRNMKVGATGLGAALTSVSFLIAGATGVFGWSIISVVVGWRISMFIGGALCLLSVLIGLRLIPGDAAPLKLTPAGLNLRAVILNRQILILCLSFAGVGAASALTSNFLVYYLEQHLGVTPQYAGLIGTLTYLCPLFVTPFFGRLYDKGKNERLLLLSTACVVTLGVAMTALGSVYAALISSIIVGVGSSAFFTVGFSATRDRSPTHDLESLTVGFADSFSFVGFFIAPLYFSSLALSYGYSSAWLVGGIAAIIFATPLLWLKRRKMA